MAREMLLAGVKPEELQPTPKTEPPQTPKGKWQNFWYHYKWAFWGVVFAVVALTVVIVQACTLNKPDYSVLFVTETAYPDVAVDVLERRMATYGEDLDGDGEVEVQFINVYMGSNLGDINNAQVLQAHLWTGDVMFYIFEPEQYDGLMTTLKNVSEGDFEFLAMPAVQSEGLREDGAWDWATDPRRQEALLKGFPEHLYFGVRYTGGTAEKSGELAAQGMKLLENFITDNPTVTVDAGG